MGGRGHKLKGTNYEREMLGKLASYNIGSERTWGSNGESRGLHKEVDLVLEPKRFDGEQHGQSKRPASIPAYIRPAEGVAYRLYCKRRKETYLALRLPDFAVWYIDGRLPATIIDIAPPNGVGKTYLPTEHVLFQVFRQDQDTSGDVFVIRESDALP